MSELLFEYIVCEPLEECLLYFVKSGKVNIYQDGITVNGFLVIENLVYFVLSE